MDFPGRTETDHGGEGREGHDDFRLVIVVFVVAMRRIPGNTRGVFPCESLNGQGLAGMGLDGEGFFRGEEFEEEGKTTEFPECSFPEGSVRTALDPGIQILPLTIADGDSRGCRGMGAQPEFGGGMIRGALDVHELRDPAGVPPGVVPDCTAHAVEGLHRIGPKPALNGFPVISAASAPAGAHIFRNAGLPGAGALRFG